MINVIVHHYALKDQVEAAKRRLLENGLRAKRFPGFVMRQTLVAEDDPLKLTTITAWSSKREYEAWSTSPQHQTDQSGVSLWSRPVERESYEVIPEQ